MILLAGLCGLIDTFHQPHDLDPPISSHLLSPHLTLLCAPNVRHVHDLVCWNPIKPPLSLSLFSIEQNQFPSAEPAWSRNSKRLLDLGSPATSWDLLERSKIISLSFANDATLQLVTTAHTCQVLYLLADSSWLTSTWFLSCVLI